MIYDPTDDDGAPRFSPTQQKILDVLADGEPHLFDDVLRGVGDPYMAMQTVFVHVSNLRRRLKLVGQAIVCEVDNRGRRYYRHVVLLPAPKIQAK